MRYINTKRIKLPAGWSRKAYDALVEAAKETNPKKRAAVIKNYSYLWRDTKECLADLSFEKCWYCETKQERSDNAVDHFRPKGKVTECEDHDGYWWLAFEWTNYRFSCSYCNSQHGRGKENRGKQNHFPLLEGSVRAYRPEDDIDTEDPCLLDPTVPTDPPLLWFNDEGLVEPKDSSDALRRQRADTSISIYNLNYVTTVQGRVILHRWIKDLVKEGNLYSDRLAFGDRSAGPALKRVMGDAMEAISPTAAFSAAARTYLMGLRDTKHPWIDDVLRAH